MTRAVRTLEIACDSRKADFIVRLVLLGGTDSSKEIGRVENSICQPCLLGMTATVGQLGYDSARKL